MHRQLLLQVSDFLLEPLDLERWVHRSIHDCLVLDLHHPRCELERRYCFFEVLLGALDVRDDHCLAIAAERVSQEVRERCLPIRNVIPLPVRESEDHLFQIR